MAECDISYCKRDTVCTIKLNVGSEKATWNICGRHQSQISLILLSPAETRVEREPDSELFCCFTCREKATAGMDILEKLKLPIIFAPCECGNKRCPRSNYHGNECTNSNAVGQPGSAWEDG